MAMNYPYPTSSPTSSGAYTTGIRSALKEKGIADDQITYDPNKGVLVGGTPFIRPEKNYAGSTYTSPQNFQSAWEAYSKSLNRPTIGATGTTAGYTPSPTGTTAGYTPPQPVSQPNQLNDQINKIIQSLQTYGQNQPAFDPYSSSAYQAAQAQTARQSQQGIRQAQEAFGSAGFGRSTGLGERAQRIGQEGTEYLMTQVIPQIQAQEQSRKQQEFQNIIAALTPLLGQQTREDLLKQQQQTREDLLRQQDIINTGNIPIPQEAQGYLDLLMSTKNQAETSAAGGAIPETMAQYQAQGDELRNKLKALGIDISGLGAETSASDVRIPNQRSMAGQTTDLNRVQTMATLTGYLPDGTPTTITQKQQLEDLWNVADQTGYVPDKLADLYGIPRGTQTQAAIKQAANIAEANQRAEVSAAREARIASTPSKSSAKSEQEANTGGPKVSTAEFNNAFQTIQQKYGVARYKEKGKDDEGNPIYDESAPPTYLNTTNPDQQVKIVLEVLNLGLNDDQTISMLNKLGITEDQARELLGG